jgi:hypothetical protein
MPEADRLTVLEQAQQLHDETLRRHGEWLLRQAQLLDSLAAIAQQHDARLAALEHMIQQHDARLAVLNDLAARHDVRMAQQAEQMARLQQILEAIRDMLDRGNGRP